MSTSTPKLASGISPARLNQIAARKLQALGIPCELSADGKQLGGELSFTPNKVVYPVTRVSIARSRFVAVGHDHLQFTEPPLATLPPLAFYDAPSQAALEERVSLALHVRMKALQALHARLTAMKVSASLDAERFAAVAIVRSVEWAFELLAAPEGIRVLRVAPLRGGQPFVVSPDYPPLSLDEHPSSADLELFLANEVPRLQAGAAGGTAPPRAEPQRPLVAEPPPQGALTLGTLVRHFGPDAILGSNCRLELVQSFSVHGSRHRFVATHESGATFKSQLVGPAGEKWADRFDLHRFPGIEPLLRTVLGLPADEPDAPSSGPGAVTGVEAPSGATGGALGAQPGEVWVMSVAVESDDGNEVRYTCMDVNGRPFGATRLLPRSEFGTLFLPHGGGYRLLICIETVQGETVTYRQLDARRQPRGTQRTLHLGVLTSNFIPEAAAY